MLDVKVTFLLSYVFLLSSLIVRFMYYLQRWKESGVFNFKSCNLLIVILIRNYKEYRNSSHYSLYPVKAYSVN